MDESPRPVAVVTGAASGIGLGVAGLLRDRGHRRMEVGRPGPTPLH